MGAYEKVSINELLKNVTYEPDPSYVPTDFSFEFMNFLKMVFAGDDDYNESPSFHYNIMDSVNNSSDIINLVYRGSGKTTLLVEILILYIASFNRLPGINGSVDVGLFLGDTIENGVKSARKNIEARYQKSDFLQLLIPKVKFTDTEWTFENAKGENVVFVGFGAASGVRGFKRFGKRPRVAIIDDIISDEAARSPTLTDVVKTSVKNAIEYTLHPTNRKIIWNGTPFNQNDPIYSAAESGAYDVNVYPICSHFDDKTTKQEFDGAWPNRHTYESVLKMYRKSESEGDLSPFYQELMLNIANEKDMLIPESQIRKYSALEDKRVFNHYITTDWAVSSNKGADYAVISVYGYRDDTWFLRDGFLGKETTDILIDMIFDYVERYNVSEVTIEVNGQQAGFVHMIRKQQVDRNIYFNIIEIRQPVGQTKLNRILSEVVPIVRRGKFVINTDIDDTKLYSEAINELTHITHNAIKSKHDDFLDTVVALSHIRPVEPSEHAVQEKPQRMREAFNTSTPFGSMSLVDLYGEEENQNPYIV